GTGTFNPPSEVVAVAPSSEDLATLTAAAPAFPPGALGFEVEVEEVNVEVALEAPVSSATPTMQAKRCAVGFISPEAYSIQVEGMADDAEADDVEDMPRLFNQHN
ncbi:unnamed protein product, partial [Cladocopium goreaui]